MSKTVFTFGRMNPPTIGHQKLADKVKSEAKKQGAMPHVYLSHTQNAKKDPLSYADKIKYARKAFGPSVTKSKSKTIIQVLQELQKMGHTEVTLVAGSDRVGEFKTFLNKYNGKDYTFDKIKVVSAGQRDPDAEGAAGMSATKIRGLAQVGDLDKFSKGIASTLNAKDIKAIYNKVRNVMGISESIEYDDTDFEFSEEELNAFVEMVDLESLDENTEIDEEFFDEERKPLTVAQRMKIGRRMKRLAPRMARKRAIMKKRMADRPRLEKRSRKAAIKLLRTRFAGKQGANYGNLSASGKMSVDRIIQKKAHMIGKISKRLLPKVRRAEMDRLKRVRGGVKKESVDQSFENYLAEACWDGYKQVGLKKKGKKMVPNCVPEEIIFEDEDTEMNTKLLYMLRQAFTNDIERQLVIRALKGGSKSLQNPKLRPFILKLLNRLLDATQTDPTMFNKMKDRLRRMSQDDSKKEVEEDKRPPQYHSGLSKSTSDKRASHFKKQGAKPDDQASAYKPAPGDAKAKTKTSKHTSNFKAMYGEGVNDKSVEKWVSKASQRRRVQVVDVNILKTPKGKFKIVSGNPPRVYGTIGGYDDIEGARNFIKKKMGSLSKVKEDMDAAFEKFISEEYIEEKSLDGLKKKAEKTGIPYGILKQVYNRGMAAWKTGHRPGTTPQQWAYARVNSFATKSKGTWGGADKDLAAKARGSKKEEVVKEGKRDAFMGKGGETWEITWSGSSGRAAGGKKSTHTMTGVKKGSSESDVKKIWQSKNKGKKFISANKVSKEEVAESWSIKMPPAEGGKTVTNLDTVQVMSFIKSKGGTDSTRKAIKKGQSVSFQGKRGTMYKIMKEEVEENCGCGQDPCITYGKVDEAKTHFVYQKDVPKYATIVHRGDEKSSREWIKKNSKNYTHKGKGFVIYKGKPGNVSPKDAIKEAKSPLQRLQDFDKTRAAVGKKPIFKQNEKPAPKKEALDQDDEKDVKDVIKGLKGASKSHAKQAKVLQKSVDEDAVKAAKSRIKRERDSDRVKHDRMLDRARRMRTQNKNRSSSSYSPRGESIDQAFENFLSEEGGAGEEGTSKLKNKYASVTPGQVCDEETYEGNEFHEKYGIMWYNDDEQLDEAEYQGKKVTLGKPTAGDVGKFKVYVKNEKGNVIKVNFGDPNMTIKKHIPSRRKSFRARHNCDNPGPRTKARYWSCKKW